jgi:hypothetical protein
MNATIAFFLFLALIVGVPLLGVAMEVRSSRKDRKAREKQDLLWLFDELDKPKYCIEFKTVYDKQLHTSISFLPFNTNAGGEYNRRTTSKQAAERYLQICYERGYFENYGGTTFPCCQIASAKVVS